MSKAKSPTICDDCGDELRPQDLVIKRDGMDLCAVCADEDAPKSTEPVVASESVPPASNVVEIKFLCPTAHISKCRNWFKKRDIFAKITSLAGLGNVRNYAGRTRLRNAIHVAEFQGFCAENGVKVC